MNNNELNATAAAAAAANAATVDCTDAAPSAYIMHKSASQISGQRSTSLDYLNFDEKRQLIASSLSLSELLHGGGPAAIAAKEVAANGKMMDRDYRHTSCDDTEDKSVRSI